MDRGRSGPDEGRSACGRCPGVVSPQVPGESPLPARGQWNGVHEWPPCPLLPYPWHHPHPRALLFKARGAFRSRPYHKNDNAHVEEKNDSVIRKFVGYDRHDSQVEIDLLNRLYRSLHLLVNWFLPSQKLLSKVRTGSHITKVYDRAQTPEDFCPSHPFVQDARCSSIRGASYPVHACWHGWMFPKRQRGTSVPPVQSWTWPACTTRSFAARDNWTRWPREDNPWSSRNVAATSTLLVSLRPEALGTFSHELTRQHDKGIFTICADPRG